MLAGAEGRHAAVVRRLRVSEPVDLVDGRGGRAACTVAAVGRDTVTCQVVSRRTDAPPSPRIVLVQALAKGDRGELAVELATEVGVDEIIPWQAARSVVRWDGERERKALERWRSTAREAAKQSRRSRLPGIVDPVTTTALAARLAAGPARALVLHESAGDLLSRADLPGDGDIVLVVGPEGGVTEGELDVLRSAGACVVRLGPTVLRTSTAGAVAIAVVSTRIGRW